MVKIDIGQNFVYLYATETISGKSIIIYFGEHEICKTEEDALALANVIKQSLSQ